MPESRRFAPPSISDEDVNWICGLLHLPQNAFTGPDGHDPRLQILKSLETLDIEACPGSGKTTLLVAKLAILARKWTDPCRGLCVLSHTNAARREIEGRLGNTVAGKRLLSYPHFVGTIHRFVNEFLAIPWLRSKPLPVRTIDDEITRARRWSRIPWKTRYALEKSKNDSEILTITDTDFNVKVKWGKGSLGRNTRTYQNIRAACKAVSEEGYFCYDEMFVWANELLDQVPAIRSALRERFPIVFIDEVQDNSETQSALLFRLFVEGDNPCVRQRFGDANQAIYGHAGQTEGATTDPFPDPRICRDIPNSHRFGQEIARLANPLALDPQNLVGCGPRCKNITADTAGKHAIFLFDDQSVTGVIPAYACYLSDVFSDRELRTGIFTAVGAVHRPAKDSKLPHSIRHYWPDYDPGLAQVEARPSTFHGYVQAGRRLARESGEAHWVAEKVAEGILRLVGILNPVADLSGRRRVHQYVLELLNDKAELRARYVELVVSLALDERGPSPEEWRTRWSSVVRAVSEAISGASAAVESVERFLEWPESEEGDQKTSAPRFRDNIYRYPLLDPVVQIRVGSIHSVKGETHTATLVLDTYYQGKHHLAALKPWLLRAKSGRGAEGPVNLLRLKQHYVAMTRPTHLLCLAVREDAFRKGEVDGLKRAGWRVARVVEGHPTWL